MGCDHGDQAVNNVTGQHDGFLHFKKLFGFNGGERVFLCIHRAILQSQVHLGKSDGRGVGTACLPGGCVSGCIGYADFQTLDVSALAEGFLGAGVASAVVGVGRDLDTAFVAKFVHHFLKQAAFGIGQQVVAIAEDEGVVSNAKTRVAACGKRGAANHDIHRPQGQALVQVGFFAQARGGEYLNIKLTLAAFFDLFCRPNRLGVVGLGRFIHMGPFEFLLGQRHRWEAGTHGQQQHPQRAKK